MKFLPVSLAMVSITTLSSALLKSSCTSSPPFARGGSAAGGASAGACEEATRAPSGTASSSAASAVRRTRSWGGRRITLAPLRVVGDPCACLGLGQGGGEAAPSAGAFDLQRELLGAGQLEQDLGTLLRAVDADPVELRDDLALLDPHLLEQASRLDRRDLHADHLPLFVLRQDARLGEEPGGAARAVFGGFRDLGQRLGRRLRRHGPAPHRPRPRDRPHGRGGGDREVGGLLE